MKIFPTEQVNIAILEGVDLQVPSAGVPGRGLLLLLQLGSDGRDDQDVSIQLIVLGRWGACQLLLLLLQGRQTRGHHSWGHLALARGGTGALEDWCLLTLLLLPSLTVVVVVVQGVVVVVVAVAVVVQGVVGVSVVSEVCGGV